MSGEVAALRVSGGGDRVTKGQAMPDGNKSGAIDGQKAENADTPNSDAKGGQASSEYASVPVTTGVSDGDCIEITSGLQEGDTVVYILQPGLRYDNARRDAQRRQHARRRRRWGQGGGRQGGF